MVSGEAPTHRYFYVHTHILRPNIFVFVFLIFELSQGKRNNNNNNPICKAPECRKTSVALADRNSRAN